MRLTRVFISFQPSATTRHRASSTKSRRRMNREEDLLLAGSALVRSTLHPMDLGLFPLVMAGLQGLQDLVGRLSLRLSVTLM